jgi:hypothetical protein
LGLHAGGQGHTKGEGCRSQPRRNRESHAARFIRGVSGRGQGTVCCYPVCSYSVYFYQWCGQFLFGQFLSAKSGPEGNVV